MLIVELLVKGLWEPGSRKHELSSTCRARECASERRRTAEWKSSQETTDPLPSSNEEDDGWGERPYGCFLERWTEDSRPNVLHTIPGVSNLLPHSTLHV